MNVNFASLTHQHWFTNFVGVLHRNLIGTILNKHPSEKEGRKEERRGFALILPWNLELSI
jgi:hypothetical protein